MTKLYHGTVTGKDDLFLETFIITGALSNKSLDPWDQRPGFYVSTHDGWAKMFGQTRSPESYVSIEKQKADEDIVNYGRGLIIEIDTDVDIKKFDFDHEMGGGWSFALLKNMRAFIPLIAAQNHGETDILQPFYDGYENDRLFPEEMTESPTEEFLRQFHDEILTEKRMRIEIVDHSYRQEPLTERQKKFLQSDLEAAAKKLEKAGDEISRQIISSEIDALKNLLDGTTVKKKNYSLKCPKDENGLGDRKTALLFQTLHDLLKENFPEEYAREKQRIFDRMLEGEAAVFKYTGTTPLKISRALLKPDDTEHNMKNDLNSWEVAYNASPQPVKKAKLAASASPPRP